MAEDELDDIIPAERFTSEPDNGNESAEAPPLMINGQYVKDLSFEAPNAPEIFNLMQGEVPAIQVDIDVEAEPKGDNLFEVALTVRAEAKIKDELAYLCEVEYAGLFTLNVPEDQLGPVLLIECPLIVFRSSGVLFRMLLGTAALRHLCWRPSTLLLFINNG